MNEQTLARLALFLRDLGQALHVSGAPAHDLEAAMKDIGSRFGAQVEGFAVLTFLALTVASGAHTRRVELLRLPPYDYNMARLIELEALCREISSVDDLDTYGERLAAIMRQPAPWSGWRFVGMGFLLSGAVAMLLRGGWVEMLCGGLIGMFFVAGFLLFARIPRLGPAVPVILCALAAIAAQGLALVFPQQTPFISAVAGIVLLLPGFMITIAMSELATRNYLAGTGRLTGAFVLLILMGAGLAIGTQVSLAWLPAVPPPESAATLPVWAVYSLVDATMGDVVGAFAGALAVANAGHLYQYLSKRPAALVQIPGLMTLVPGSMGFRGVHALIQQDSMAGISLITDMVLTGAVLAVGLLLADNILPVLFERRGGERVSEVEPE